MMDSVEGDRKCVDHGGWCQLAIEPMVQKARNMEGCGNSSSALRREVLTDGNQTVGLEAGCAGKVEGPEGCRRSQHRAAGLQ